MGERGTPQLLMARERLIPRGLFNVFPLFVRSGQGALLEDVEGRRYIDLTSGIGVNNLGHCHPAIVEAIEKQARRFVHTCFQVGMYASLLDLAEVLHRQTPGTFPKKTFFTNSGAEAIEGAVKFARAYTGRDAVLSFHYAFHGRTFYALSLTGRAKPYRWGFGPVGGEVHRIPFPYGYRSPFGPDPEACVDGCLRSLEEVFVTGLPPEAFAAFVFEPILGEGGIVVPPPGFFRRLSEVCRHHGILTIADEVQSGIGRSGTFCAAEQFDIEPDLVVLAKSLGFGIPVGAVTGRAEVLDALETGGLGGTTGGNPLACAAALAGLRVMEEDKLFSRARDLGARTLARLRRLQEGCPLVGDVRGLGLMVGLELVKDPGTREPAVEATRRVAQRCLEQGVLVLHGGPLRNVLRLLPPLTISDQEMEQALATLEESIRHSA